MNFVIVSSYSQVGILKIGSALKLNVNFWGTNIFITMNILIHEYGIWLYLLKF